MNIYSHRAFVYTANTCCSRNATDCPLLSFILFLSQDIPGHPNEHHPRMDILVHRRLPWNVLGHPRPLGYPGISQDIPDNSSMSVHSHVQHILLCPRMSQNIPGHPNKRYAVPARTFGDIPEYPSQLLHIQTIPCPAHPIS